MDLNRVLQWQEVATKLRFYKAKEREMRLEIAEEVLQGATGTKHKYVDNHDVVAVGKLSHKVDSAALQSIWHSLSPEEQNAIKWEPNIIKKGYDKLPKDCMLSQVVTTKPGMPTLKLKEKKSAS